MNETAAQGFYRKPRLGRWIFILLCLAGLVVSLDLAWLHYKVHTDPGFHSFCAISDSFNCETVAESRYSVFFGLPIALWGVLGYFLLGALAAASLFSAKHAPLHAALFLFSAGSVVCSLILALVSYCIICSFCLLCTVSYFINLALLAVLTAMTRFRCFPWSQALREAVQNLKRRPLIVVLGALFLGMLAACFPRYWEREESQRSSDGLSFGVTPEKSHWIGAARPILTIVEYSDYLCPHCRRGHMTMRKLVLANPDKVRLVHRHFPLDHECNSLIQKPFHKKACFLAGAAYCAGEQGKFWEMNDLLVNGVKTANSTPADQMIDYAGNLELDLQAFNECLNSERAVNSVKRDIELGLRLGIKGTPAYQVGEKVYLGVLPPEAMAGLAGSN